MGHAPVFDRMKGALFSIEDSVQKLFEVLAGGKQSFVAHGQSVFCPRCGVILNKGRWKWGLKPANARKALCPCCVRSTENAPAGLLTVKGSFLYRQKSQILSLARETETELKREMALARILSIDERLEAVEIITTDIRLLVLIAEKLRQVLPGAFRIRCSKYSPFLRITFWLRLPRHPSPPVSEKVPAG